MINPATQPVPDWNEFTEHLCANPGTMVKLRNGVYVKPVFSAATHETETDCFTYYGGDFNGCWSTNGKSITSRDFDMMEIENVDS